MSTRANIELYDGWKGPNGMTVWQKRVVLYHHCDGYPAWLGPELETKLHRVKAELDQAGYSYWWDSQRVGALIVVLSANDSDYYKSVPHFQPCLELHGDIDYLWRIFLGPEQGKYDLQCYSISHDWDKDVVKQLQPVDWRKEVESKQRR